MPPSIPVYLTTDLLRPQEDVPAGGLDEPCVDAEPARPRAVRHVRRQPRLRQRHQVRSQKGASIYTCITSSVGGSPQKSDERNKISLFLYLTRGEGIKKPKNFADVIYGSPKWKLYPCVLNAVVFFFKFVDGREGNNLFGSESS